MKQLISLLVLFLCVLCCDAQIINTFAGSGVRGNTGDGLAATLAALETPSGIAVDRSGNVYFSDQNASCIRRVSTSGIITTIAGTGSTGYSGDGGPAIAAKIYWPTGVAVDRAGNVYIADQFNNAIRKVSSTVGIITTIAGGTIGFGGDGGPATAAKLWHPNDVGVDTFGNVYVADRDNHAIRKIDTAGIITTIAGNDTAGYRGDGGPATAAEFNYPSGLSVDKWGNIFVADFFNSCIRKIDTAGMITTVAGNGIKGYTPDGAKAIAAEFGYTSAVTTDSMGNIFFTDYNNYYVRKVDTAGILTTIAGNGVTGYSGDGMAATAASVTSVEGVGVDAGGNVYIADFYNNRVRKIAPAEHSLQTNVLHKNITLDVYPDPATGGTLSIHTTGVDGSYNARLVNVAGVAVLSQICSAARVDMDISYLPKGVYTLLLTYGGTGTLSRKVVID